MSFGAEKIDPIKDVRKDSTLPKTEYVDSEQKHPAFDQLLLKMIQQIIYSKMENPIAKPFLVVSQQTKVLRY